MLAIFCSAISCANSTVKKQGLKPECLSTVKKLLLHLGNNNGDSVKVFCSKGIFDDSIGFYNDVRNASIMLSKCDKSKIDSAIVFADTNNMKAYSPIFNEYQLKLYSKSNEYLGEITFTFRKQHCEKIANLFVFPKPSEIKEDIDFSGILDSNGNPLLQTWRAN